MNIRFNENIKNLRYWPIGFMFELNNFLQENVKLVLNDYPSTNGGTEQHSLATFRKKCLAIKGSVVCRILDHPIPRVLCYLLG